MESKKYQKEIKVLKDQLVIARRNSKTKKEARQLSKQ